MTDLVDWADVAAVGVMALRTLPHAGPMGPVAYVLALVEADLEWTVEDLDGIAAALRSAYAAGREDAERERGTCLECARLWFPARAPFVGACDSRKSPCQADDYCSDFRRRIGT